jgi:hypothetical protein
VFEGDTDKVSLLTVKNKLSFGGHRMVANFINFDEEPMELQVRGKVLSSKGKILLNNEPIARFEGGIPEAIADEPNKSETASKMTVAPLGAFPLLVWPIVCVFSYCCVPLVDVALMVIIFLCLQDLTSKD